MPDWVKIGKIIDTALETGIVLLSVHQFQKLIKLDREIAKQQITSLVQSSSTDELDRFEVNFLNYSHSLFDAAQKTRAMELYAWLKLVEFVHYGNQFRGFATQGRSLV